MIVLIPDHCLSITFHYLRCLLVQESAEPDIEHTVDSRYLDVEGTRLNTSRYPYFDISDVQN